MIVVFQWIAFIVLSAISFFFTFNLSYGLAADIIGKIAMIVGSVGLEFTKMYSIMSASTYSYIGKQLGVKMKKTAFMYFAYVFIAIYAISASFGYAQQTVDKMRTANTVVLHSDEINIYMDKIATINGQISDLKAKIADKQASIAVLPADNITRKAAIQAEIDKANRDIDTKLTAKETAQAKIDELKLGDLQASQGTTRSMYDVVGETLKVPAQSVAFVILFWFALAIEFGIFVTAPHMRKIGGFVVEKGNENFDYEIAKKNKKAQKTQKKQQQKVQPKVVEENKKNIFSFLKKEKVEEVKEEPAVPQKMELPEPVKEEVKIETPKVEEKVEEVKIEVPKVVEKAKVVDNNIPERKSLEEPVVRNIGQHPDKVVKKTMLPSGPEVQVISNKDKEPKITTHEEIFVDDNAFTPAKSKTARDLISKF